MRYALTYENSPNREDIKILSQGLAKYAEEQRDHKPVETFAFFIRDENNEIKGGVNGVFYFGCLYVDQLWVEECLRKQNYGTELMIAAEKLAKEKGCGFATVNTMDWEALEFYKKLGYQIEFERRGYHKNSIFYFLRKKL